jgi:hypothetical protein
MRFQQSYQSVSYKYLVDVCRCNICLCLLILYSTKLHILWYYYHKTVNLSLCFTKLHISHPLYHNRFYISCVPAYPMHEIRPPSLVWSVRQPNRAYLPHRSDSVRLTKQGRFISIKLGKQTRHTSPPSKVGLVKSWHDRLQRASLSIVCRCHKPRDDQSAQVKAMSTIHLTPYPRIRLAK